MFVMEFPYGIPSESLRRLEAFQRIRAHDALHSTKLTKKGLKTVIDQELAAIGKATARSEIEELNRLMEL